MKRKKRKQLDKTSRIRVALSVMVLLVAVLAATLYYQSHETIVAVNLSLQFDGIEKGMNPDDTRFAYTEITEEEVLQYVFAYVGIPYSPSASELFKVTPVLPANSVDRIKSELVAGNDYTYFPNEFKIEIAVDSDKGIGKAEAKKLAEAYPEAYQSYFIERYSYPFMDLRNILSYFDYTNYDYSEYSSVFEKEYDIIKNYLLILEKEDPEFRSDEGYTFRNMIEAISLSKELTLKDLNALVDQYDLSKNTEQLIVKYLYMVRRYEQAQNIDEGTFVMTQELLDLIEANRSNVLLPNVSGENITVSILNGSYDEMVAKANASKVSSKENEEQIRFLLKEVESLQNPTVSAYELKRAKDQVDLLVNDLSTTLKSYADVVEGMAKEYFQKRYQKSIVSVGDPIVDEPKAIPVLAGLSLVFWAVATGAIRFLIK